MDRPAREHRSFMPTFRENQALPKPTFAENEPTFGSWPLLVMWFGSAIQVYIDAYV
jgi:hypothetical protein